MICKFTHPSFELDFQGKNITIVEENHWFSDQFFTKYTFPVSFDIDDELDTALNMITHQNSAASAKKFTGYLQEFGRESEAVLIIERIQGKTAQGKMRFGFEEFPNYDKKLPELPLDKFPLLEDMTTFAEGIITQSFPDVNFNFPQIIVDSIDTNTIQWQYFEGLLNNYVNGAFLENEYDVVNDEQINRNIMQPMPYLLHILTVGFAEKGLTLTGEILEDPEFKKALLVIISKYYSTVSPNSQELYKIASEYNELVTLQRFAFNQSENGTIQAGRYQSTLLLQEPGIYKIAGNVSLRLMGFPAYATLHLNMQEVWKAQRFTVAYSNNIYNLDVNIEVSVAQGSAALNFNSLQLPYELVGSEQFPDASIVDLTITKISGFDEEGNRTPSLITPEEINLQKCVPDITFGELLKILKNWKNYDILINHSEGTVEMNKVENLMNTGEPVDLSDYEEKYPIREFYQDKSYVLKFQDVQSEEYKFAQMYIDSEGGRTTSFVKQEDTSEIIINAIPLPLKQQGIVSTGHCFIDSESQVFFALYDGLTEGLNLCQDPGNLLIPAVYESDWKKWLYFRIIAEGIEWTIVCHPELAGQIKKTSRIAAYGKIFFVKRVTKKNTSRNYWEVILECDGAD